MAANKKFYFSVYFVFFSLIALLTSCNKIDSLVSCMSPKNEDSKVTKKSQLELKKERGFLATWDNATDLFHEDEGNLVSNVFHCQGDKKPNRLVLANTSKDFPCQITEEEYSNPEKITDEFLRTLVLYYKGDGSGNPLAKAILLDGPEISRIVLLINDENKAQELKDKIKPLTDDNGYYTEKSISPYSNLLAKVSTSLMAFGIASNTIVDVSENDSIKFNAMFSFHPVREVGGVDKPIGNPEYVFMKLADVSSKSENILVKCGQEESTKPRDNPTIFISLNKGGLFEFNVLFYEKVSAGQDVGNGIDTTCSSSEDPSIDKDLHSVGNPPSPETTTFKYTGIYIPDENQSNETEGSHSKSLEDDNPVEENPEGDKPTEDKPTEENPTEDKPTEDKPTEDKPTEDKPTED